MTSPEPATAAADEGEDESRVAIIAADRNSQVASAERTYDVVAFYPSHAAA